MHFVFQTGKRKRQTVQLDLEALFAIGLPAESVNFLAGRKAQPERIAGPVDELTGRDILRAADFFGVHVFVSGRYEQQLRRSAGQVPRQMRRIHQIHAPGRPAGSRDVPLLMGKRIKRHAQNRCQILRLTGPRQKTGHV